MALLFRYRCPVLALENSLKGQCLRQGGSEESLAALVQGRAWSLSCPVFRRKKVMFSQLRTVFTGLAAAVVLSGCAAQPLTGGNSPPSTTSSSRAQPYLSATVPFRDRAAMHYDFQAKVACQKAKEVLDGYKVFLQGRIPELKGVVAKSQVRDCHMASMGRDRYGRPVSTFRTAISYFPSSPFPGYEQAYTQLLQQACSAAQSRHALAGEMRQKKTGMPPMPTRNAVQCYPDTQGSIRYGAGWMIVDVLRPQGS